MFISRQTSRKLYLIIISNITSPVIFIAGRPKAAVLFWFFGDFRCIALLFMITLYINIKIGTNSVKF